MEKLKKAFGACLVPLLSILLAFLIGGIIMAALGADPFVAVKFLFQGAFGTKAGIGTTLTKATPLMFTALCACFAYKCGVFNLGGEGQFLMGSMAAFLTCYFTGLTGFAGIVLAARLSSGQPTSGADLSLQAIAAVYIGGTFQGSVVNTMAGALVWGFMNNALNLMNVNAYWQKVALGVIIIIAVLFDAFRAKLAMKKKS